MKCQICRGSKRVKGMGNISRDCQACKDGVKQAPVDAILYTEIVNPAVSVIGINDRPSTPTLLYKKRGRPSKNQVAG